jgi:probable dihydroxyacetone kinase regulator
VICLLGTEKVFADALLTLAENTHIRDIKITQLLSQAGAGRQTFYNHFEDKYDLVGWIYSDMGDQMDKILSPTEDIEKVFQKLFDFFTENKRFFANINNISSENEFFSFMAERMTNYYSSRVVRCHGMAYLTNEIIFAITFNCDGFAHSCWRWMGSGMPQTSHAMARRMINNMSPVLRKMTSL